MGGGAPAGYVVDSHAIMGTVATVTYHIDPGATLLSGVDTVVLEHQGPDDVDFVAGHTQMGMDGSGQTISDDLVSYAGHDVDLRIHLYEGGTMGTSKGTLGAGTVSVPVGAATFSLDSAVWNDGNKTLDVEITRTGACAGPPSVSEVDLFVSFDDGESWHGTSGQWACSQIGTSPTPFSRP